MAESRLRRLDDGRYEYTPKKGVSFTVTAPQLVRRLDWAALHHHTFAIDVFRCPSCGGRPPIIAVHSTRTAAEARLSQLGHPQG